MLITSSNIDIWYSEYLEQFKRSEKYVKKNHGITRGIPPLNRRLFETDFLTMASTNPNASGMRIAQKMAKNEVYGISWSQAYRLAEAEVKRHGGTLSMAKVLEYYIHDQREGKRRTISDIKEYRREKFEMGESRYQVRLDVSQEFFGGSP